MTDVTRIVGLGIVVSVLLTLLRKEMPPMAVQVAMAFVVVALLFLVEPLRQAVDTFLHLAAEARVRTIYVEVVLKAIGIAYIASIGSELSRDAGKVPSPPSSSWRARCSSFYWPFPSSPPFWMRSFGSCRADATRKRGDARA